MDEVEAIYRRILSRGDCLSLKQLKVTGDDLICAGIPEGKQIGRILNSLLNEVLSDPGKNEREILLEIARILWENERDAEKIQTFGVTDSKC